MQTVAISCPFCPVSRMFDCSPMAIDCQQVTRVSTVPSALVLTAVLTQGAHGLRSSLAARLSAALRRDRNQNRQRRAVHCRGHGQDPDPDGNRLTW